MLTEETPGGLRRGGDKETRTDSTPRVFWNHWVKMIFMGEKKKNFHRDKRLHTEPHTVRFKIKVGFKYSIVILRLVHFERPLLLKPGEVGSKWI